MKRFIVLAQSEVTAQAIESCLIMAGVDINQDCCIQFTPQLVDDVGVGDYKMLVDKMECLMADKDNGRLCDTTILVDSIHPNDLHVVSTSCNWGNLVAMLILTFPEVRWLFGVIHHPEITLFKDHNLTKIFSGAFRDPLLDPTGLRNWVREKTNEAIVNHLKEDLILPFRHSNRLAAAIDDEHYFAYFNAYTAYRFGCRADVITSWQIMEDLFIPKNPGYMTYHPYWLLLEDMSLNFPDRPADMHLSNLKDRAEQCKLLGYADKTADQSTHRILVTGQSRPGDHTLAENREYLRRHKKGSPRIIYKPVSGMFDLWGQIGLLRKKTKTKRTGNVDWFKWPPDRPGKNEGQGNQEDGKRITGHGTTGKLLLVAETLIHRAEAMRVDSITTVERVLLCAVMATDALELTGGRTPTTAIEALSLKHRFEVMMECKFLGNEYNIHVEERFQEIEFDLKRITIWAHRRMRRLTAMNAKMSIIVQIMRIFREYGQFDEEQLCLKHTRTLNRRLFFAKHPGLSFLHPVRWYIDKLIGSISLLVTAIVVWPLALGGLMALLGTSWENLKEMTFIDHVTNAFYMFIAQTPAGFPQGFWAHMFTFGVSLIGIIHFGVFIAYLYNLFYRR